MKKEDKKYYNYKPKFKACDIIVRNDQAHDSWTAKGLTQFVNPYHSAYHKDSVLTVSGVEITEFDTFFHKGYLFKEQLNNFNSMIVDIEYDLYLPGMRKAKIKKLKKCITQNTKKVTLL